MDLVWRSLGIWLRQSSGRENSWGHGGSDKRCVQDKGGKRELGVVQLCGIGDGIIVV